jgi:hypothetical protein
VIGASEAVREHIAPTLEFLRPLPASAVILVAIAIFGLTLQMAGIPALPTHLWTAVNGGDYARVPHHHRFDASRTSLVPPVVGRLDRGAV